MCTEKEVSFSIFMLYSLAEKWGKTLAAVYKILNSTGILDNYTDVLTIPAYAKSA